MAMATSSLLLPSISKTLISFSTPKTLISPPLSISFFSPSSRRFSLRSAASRASASSSETGEGFSSNLKLFVGNLPFDVDSSDLADLFVTAGNVQMVEVIYDKMTGRSKGYGFVTMSTIEEVEAAAQQFNGYELKGRALRVGSGPSPRREDLKLRGGGGGGSRSSSSFDAANRVYVGNLPWGVDNLGLETLCSDQGKVMDAKVVYDRDTGRSRGFGFVTFSSPEEVANAISSLDGCTMDGRSIRVSPAEAKSPKQES